MTLSANFLKTVTFYESLYESCLSFIADTVSENGKIRLINIAGPSCSGKTTTTKKLVSNLKSKGVTSHMVSIDDFYKNPEDLPLGKDGMKDYESPDCIDLTYLHECLTLLTSGKEAKLPYYDFTKKRRSDNYRSIKLSEHEVVILEGLHALNPRIYKGYVGEDKIYKIFLDAVSSDGLSDDARLIRRIVRDINYRNVDALETLSLWDNVKDGEKKYIYSYVHHADIIINTYFCYEMSVLKDSLLSAIKDFTPESEYYDMVCAMRKSFEKVTAQGKEIIPEDSLLWEFVK